MRVALPRRLMLAAVLLVALGGLVRSGTLANLDQTVYSAVQPLGGIGTDRLLSAVTLIGRADVAIGIALVVALAVVIRQRSRLLALALLGIVVLPPIADVLKATIGQHRPPPGTGHDLQLLPALLPKRAETLSFPSSHVALAAFLAVVIGHLAPRWAAVLWVLPIAVAVSRLYLDKHWASDVVGGILLGIIVGEVSWLAACFLADRADRRSGGTYPPPA